MKILIKGYYGFGNFGDDILMITTYRILREAFPDAEYFIFSNHNENLRGFSQKKGYNQYVVDLLSSDVKMIDWTYKGYFDFIIDGGGGVYFGSGKGSAGHQILNRIVRYIGCGNVAWIDRTLRKLSGRHTHLTFGRRIGFGLGIGPYTTSSPLTYRHAADLGSYSAMIVRDANSVAELKNFKFAAPVWQFTDIAFLMSRWSESSPTPNASANKIGIILMDLGPDTVALFDTFFRLASILSREFGKDVCFISFDQNYDKKFIERFSNTPFELITWEPTSGNLQPFLRRIAEQSILITARAHGAILGGQLGSIPLCLGLSRKLRDVSRMFSGLPSLIEKPYDIDEIVSRVTLIDGRRAEFGESLYKDCQSNKSLAKQSELQLIGLMKNQ